MSTCSFSCLIEAQFRLESWHLRSHHRPSTPQLQLPIRLTPHFYSFNMSSSTFAPPSAGAYNLLCNPIKFQMDYCPPGSKTFRRRLVRRLHSIKPAKFSLIGEVRYVAFSALDKLHRFVESKPTTPPAWTEAPPPSRAPTITAPWIYVTPPEASDPEFRPIRRQHHIYSTRGLRGARDAALMRRLPQDDSIVLQSPEQERLYDEIDKLLTPPEPSDIAWASCPSLSTDEGSDGESNDPDSPLLKDLSGHADQQIKDFALTVGIFDVMGNVDEAFQQLLYNSAAGQVAVLGPTEED
ncbi:hypothetical protein FA95DRAFT_1028574 [Auriscalpium vulgare]|uniref:Uncharacterized protein n=1 Tax=Auriscalpium vulgare TaxID=40419 RepID=A0ACB8R5L9_9AGAM|nr:hypothetical protein FA95DRAFT_1028574 [Auriscalpium vulgare]